MNYLETIKRILDSDAGLIIEDMSQSKNKKVILNHFQILIFIIERLFLVDLVAKEKSRRLY